MMTALTNALTFVSNLICPKHRKVIFLGAGASKDAGYPLTTELYDVLEKNNKDSIVVNNKAAWSQFEESMTAIKTEFPLFADCNNIEYLITLLSLTQKFSEQKSLPPSIDDLHNEELMNEILKNSSTANTYEAAKMNFARCIESTLGYMDHDMQDIPFKYLTDFLNRELTNKDTVITTNYDLLVERCLNSKKLWNAHDGYGFTVEFKGEYTGKKIDSELMQYNTKKSSIKILKLHGSVGWLNGNNKIVLDTSSLQKLIPRTWKDKNYTPNIYDDKHLILPDFLKAYENQTMLEIWAQAQQAIMLAHEVHIIGFSLPEYDANIRTLLLPLRYKLIKGKCKVKIYILNSDKDSQERWENHLTNKIEIIRYESLKKYCESLP